NAALGPYRLVFDPAVVATLAVLGSIFLLFLIGLDFDFRAVYTPRNIAVAFGGVVLPLVVGFGTALYLAPTTSIGVNGTRFTMALFVGATFTATSVAITSAVLLEFNFLKDPVAQTILGAAVVDDVLAGGVFAGAAFRNDFSEGARHLAAVFTPIFFVSLGLQVNVPAVAAQIGLIPLAAALTVVAVITKVVGCSLPARLAKMTVHEAVAIGWGMTPRGEVGLIVAVAALTAGVIGDALFSVIVFVLILVTI